MKREKVMQLIKRIWAKRKLSPHGACKYWKDKKRTKITTVRII